MPWKLKKKRKTTFETHDFYEHVSILNCNQKSTVYSDLMNAAYTAEKMHCKILEKWLQLIQWFLDRIFVFFGTMFLKTLTILKPSCSAELIFEEQCNVLIVFQYFFYVVTVEKADSMYLKPCRSVFNGF